MVSFFKTKLHKSLYDIIKLFKGEEKGHNCLIVRNASYLYSSLNPYANITSEKFSNTLIAQAFIKFKALSSFGFSNPCFSEKLNIYNAN